MATNISSEGNVKNVQQIIQIEMLKAKNEIDNKGVLELYEDLENLKPPRADTFIPSSGNAGSENTYMP